MPYPTVERVRRVIDNGDGTVTEIHQSIRANGDRSQMVFHRASAGPKYAIWHIVYDALGDVIHGPEEKYRRPGYDAAWPPPGYSRGW